jgi:hypothetical protein
VDSLVSAEFPDKDTHPRLHALVCAHMTHGPCGAQNSKAPCMRDGKCQKHFPKEFKEVTTMNEDGYPGYRRRNTGVKHEVRGTLMDNRDVVPFNAYLLLKFQCHINVELTFGVRSIKYIHKYIYKGHDCTTMEFGKDKDEVQQYLDARFVSAPEAFWRITRHEIHHQSPSVEALPVHLPDEQSVIFDATANPAEILARAENSKSKLLAYFRANATEKDAPKYFYIDFPTHFTWHDSACKWKPRVRGAVIAVFTSAVQLLESASTCALCLL